MADIYLQLDYKTKALKFIKHRNCVTDLDDDFFWFKNINETYIEIWEAYKISNNKNEPIKFSNIGFWSREAGLIISSAEKWKRRKDLQGHFFKVATLEDKPYVDLKISDKTGFEISGIFGDVFCDLKVNFSSRCLLLLEPYSYHQIPGKYFIMICEKIRQ